MAQNQSRLPEINLGVIGHQGHGKTTLTAALLKHAAARFGSHPGEQLLTLNTKVEAVDRVRSYQFHTRTRRYGHLDIPGARERIRVTSRAISQLDAAVLLVDVTRAVQAQTREHLLMAQGAGVSQVVVFLNRCDEARDPEWIDEVEREVRLVLIDCGFPGDEVPFVRGSALGAYELSGTWGESIDRLIDVLDQELLDPSRDEDLPPRMSIEEVRFARTTGWIALGRVEQGVLRSQKNIALIGLRAAVSILRVATIERYRQRVTEAYAGSFVGVAFDNPDGVIPRAGQVMVQPDSATTAREFIATLRVIPLREWGRHTQIVNNHRVYLHLGSAGVAARLTLPEGATALMPGDELEGVRVSLEAPLWIEPGRTFVMRDGTDGFRQLIHPKYVWNGRRNVMAGEPMMAGTALSGTITAILR